MKKYSFMLLSLFGVFACNSKTDQVRSFIPGTYVQYSENEMGKRYDTLIIEQISETGNNYRLIRNSSFQRVLDGQAFPWQQKKEIWTGIYDEPKRVLNETSKGRVISFVPEKKILIVGSTEFKKIK